MPIAVAVVFAETPGECCVGECWGSQLQRTGFLPYPWLQELALSLWNLRGSVSYEAGLPDLVCWTQRGRPAVAGAFGRDRIRDRPGCPP